MIRSNSMAGNHSKSFNVTLLIKQLRDLKSNCQSVCSVELADNNLFEWNIVFKGPKHTIYEGAVFRANLKFPEDFPEHPPVMYFKNDMWHPNSKKNRVFLNNLLVHPDGKVCISLLHPRDQKENDSDDLMSERWRPCATVEQVLDAVIAMLTAPNVHSPANTEAGTQYMYDRQNYEERVRALVRKSKEDL